MVHPTHVSQPPVVNWPFQVLFAFELNILIMTKFLKQLSMIRMMNMRDTINDPLSGIEKVSKSHIMTTNPSQFSIRPFFPFGRGTCSSFVSRLSHHNISSCSTSVDSLIHTELESMVSCACISGMLVMRAMSEE